MRNRKRVKTDFGPFAILIILGLAILLPPIVKQHLIPRQQITDQREVMFSWLITANNNGMLYQLNMPVVEPGNKPLALPQDTRPLFSLPISLNLADRQTLTAIPGIGTHLSNEIIKLRRQKGNFVNFSELREINGIGSRKTALLKRHCRI